MRTPSLQYLYLQKPVTMVVILCALSVLPWISMGDYSSICQSNEITHTASVILETEDWVLPKDESGDFIYQPPMMSWMIAVLSLPQGFVSDFTARLPSALAFITLIGFTLFFFGERIKFQEAFICTLLLLTSAGMHLTGMLPDTDMLFTTFVVLALYGLYRWENKLELKGLPVTIPVLLGCAVLTKGLVGIALPLSIYILYLFVLKKHRLGTILRVVFYIGVSSMFLPLIWYAAAWQENGGHLLRIILSNDYDTGVERGVLYNVMMLVAGFMPWAIFFLFSLFGIKLYSLRKTGENLWVDIKQGLRSMEKMKLFSLVVLVCIFFFFSFLPVKRLPYLLPAYPFIAVFLAQYSIYLTEYRTKVTRVFAIFLLTVIVSVFTLAGLSMANIIELPHLTISFTLDKPGFLQLGIILVIVALVITLIYQLRKKINIKILYATIALVYALNFLIDSLISF